MATTVFGSTVHGQTAPAPLAARPGWVVQPTTYRYGALIQRLEEAVKANNMGVINVPAPPMARKSRVLRFPATALLASSVTISPGAF
jgi:hypothetical protein